MQQLTNLSIITKEEFKELLTEIGYPEAYESFLEQFDLGIAKEVFMEDGCKMDSIDDYFAEMNYTYLLLFNFEWESSKEGEDYWKNINKTINELVIYETE